MEIKSKSIAVILAEGFEEGEAITIVDILRRAGFTCDTVGLLAETVTGSHSITIKADKILSSEIENYDMIVLPGGMPGAANLRDSDPLIKIVKNMYHANKFVSAMCAGPIVLERAGLLDGHNYTAYPGYEKRIVSTGVFLNDIVVIDNNLITSRGPATVYEFAYALVDQLGGDSKTVKERMLYQNSFNSSKEIA